MHRSLRTILATALLLGPLGCHMSHAKPLWTKRDFHGFDAALTHSAVVLLDQPSHSLYVLDARDGNPRWSHDFVSSNHFAVAPDGSTFIEDGGHILGFDADGKKRFDVFPKDHEYSYSSIWVIDGHLFTAGMYLRVGCFDLHDGHWIWGVANNVESTVGEVVQVVGNLVLSFTDEDVMANDLATGQEKWRYKLSQKVFEEGPRLRPSLVTSHGPAAIYTVDGPQLVALDVGTGKVVWKQAVQGLTSFVAGHEVMLVADEKTARGLDARTGRVRWSLERRGPSLAALLDGNTALLQSAERTETISLLDGKPHTWAHHASTKDDQVLAASDGIAVLTYDAIDARLFKLTGGKLEDLEASDHPPLWQVALDRAAASREPMTARIVDGTVLIRYKNGAISLYRP